MSMCPGRLSSGVASMLSKLSAVSNVISYKVEFLHKAVSNIVNLYLNILRVSTSN